MNRSRGYCHPGWATALLSVLLLVLVPALAPGQSIDHGDPEGELERRDDMMRRSLEQLEHRDPGRQEDVAGREEWFEFQRRFPYAMIPAGTRSMAVRAVRQMEDRARQTGKGGRLLSTQSWTPAGPYNIGGRLRAIAQHPTNGGIYFVGAAAGGVWKTIDSGRTWTTTFDKESAIAIGALAIDYTNPSTIFAGTGEFTANSDSYLGDGIFRSTDEGTTWSNVGLRGVGSFSALAVHRQNPQIVYALGAKQGGGFYRSTDGGDTWKLVQSLNGFAMSVNPDNSDEVMITTANAVLRSTDAGLSWTPSRGISSGGLRRISVAHAPSNPAIAYAVCARYNGSGDLAVMYRSTDGGANWTHRAEIGTYFFRDQGWYNNCIAVHPDSPQVVLAGGIDIFRTDDGGTTWANFTDSYTNIGEYDNHAWVHPDQHFIEFSPVTPGQVLIANDGGVHLSPDAGLRWRRLSLVLPVTQFYRIDVDPFDSRRIYGGTQDNGSLATVVTEPGRWRPISGGDGFWVAVDPFDPTIVYSEIYFAQAIYRVDTRTNTVTPIHYPINEMGGERGDWSTPLACSPYDGRLYSARVNIYRTSDQGSSWERVYTGATSFISSIALSYQRSEHILIGTTNGEIRVTTDDGATWRRAQGIPGRYVTDIKFDPNIADRVYATVSGTGSGHVFRSDDGGLTFTNISANLPDVPTNTVAVDPENTNHLFVGTDAGVLVSLDGGGLWLPFNQGMPYAPVVDLRVAYGERTLIAATHGRSSFSIDITQVVPEPLMIAPAGGETVVSPGRIEVRWLGLEGPVRISLSLDGGVSWTTVAENVIGQSSAFDVGLVRTTTARVGVVETEGERRSIASEDFTILGATNGSEMGLRSVIAEAIDVRRGEIWASARGTDSMFTYRLPLLSGRQGMARIDLPGRIHDLAYDQVSDRFYVLTGEDDFSDARLWIMDTTARGITEIALPVRTVRGVAVTPSGIALATLGESPEILIIDTAGNEVSRYGPGQSAPPADRRSLAWDDQAFVQGAMTADSAYAYTTFLERLHPRADFRVSQRTPAVLGATTDLQVVGLAYSPDTAAGVRGVYWVTDTAGKFYRFVAGSLFSGVDAPLQGMGSHGGVTLEGVQPNPVQDRATIEWRLERGGSIEVNLYAPDGRLVRELFHGQQPTGQGGAILTTNGIPSGIYYIALTVRGGGRVVRPVVIVR